MTIFRLARRSDATDLAKLAEATFRDTFSEQNTPENMDAHCQSSYGKEIQGQEIASPEYVTIVAESDGKLVAYAQLRCNSAPSCVSATCPGEIQRLYVDKDFHGKGLAHKLMNECLKSFEERTDFVELGSLKVFNPANRHPAIWMVDGIESLHDCHPSHAIWTILIVLPAFVQHNIPLILKFLARQSWQQVAHPVRLHPKSQIEGTRGHNFPVVGTIGVS